MSSLQNPAPGAKSMKFVDALNPFAPFLSRPGDAVPEEEPAPLTEQFDTRLRLDPSVSRQQPSQGTQQQYLRQKQVAPSEKESAPNQQPSFRETTASKKKNSENDISDDEEEANNSDDSDSDSEFDYLLDDDDDDAVLQAIRQKRLKELQKAHAHETEHKAKGHGEVRTITQDEFLSECNSSGYAVVHFFHKEFQKCKVMDHHLKILAETPQHLSCKFVRIDAEKAPFFVVKLKVKTLPTLLVFKDGKLVERLLGFEGLVSSSSRSPGDMENFPTSRLGYWLESVGAIEYDGPDSDDEADNLNQRGSRNRTRIYDEDI